MEGNSTIKAAEKASKVTLALAKAARQRKNVQASIQFTAGIMGIIFIFTLYFWTRTLYSRTCTNNKIFQIPVKISRFTRKVLLRKVPGFNSAGHAVVFFFYMIISLAILFTNINWENLTGLAKRLGWLSVLNFTLTIFLGLKNTPIAILTNHSYEKLNGLHQVAGLSCIFSALLHTIIYLINLKNLEKLYVLRQEDVIFGMVAGVAFLIIYLTATFLRKRHYETFYMIHISMTILALITAGIHRPNVWRTKSSYILVFGGIIWGLDRLIRLTKLSRYSFGNSATITPLPHGGVRVVLSKAVKSAAPGNHFFVWLPGIRILETHPFTCISTNPVEFIISAQESFTRDLYNHAVQQPGAVLRASIDGPYGMMCDLTVFHKIVFIAGGSGASFTCGLAIDLLNKMDPSKKIAIDFTLVLREKEMIEWTSSYLSILAASPIVNLQVYITRSLLGDSRLYTPNNFHQFDFSRIHSCDMDYLPRRPNVINPMANFEEKGIPITNASSTISPILLTPGRADVATLISQAIKTTSPSQRIAVAACGPDAMMLTVRRAVAENIRLEGPAVELFCEQFSW